ncbi:hypothetical protein [Rhodococcus sp. W8901]|uniref:hypothetical protein n=1 Tax=Rhodococcus sp. W8901 TaxID=2742603 RepID=UPI001581B4C6|nr:hypothetical protein [Rhodococcus sp. W8901]QKT13728.1 hypothetical protein HUN07_25900 [Rhodococcus sp. W8901]
MENGNVYVTDTFNNRVLELAAGRSAPTTLPFGTPNNPSLIAVENGNVYISDLDRRQVFKLAAGTATLTTLPFRADAMIGGIAVHNGDLFVTDESNSYTPEFGSFGPTPPGGTVRKIPGGTESSTVVPFRGFQGLAGIAVNGGKVYITDQKNKRVLALPVDTPAAGLNTGSIGVPFGS